MIRIASFGRNNLRPNLRLQFLKSVNVFAHRDGYLNLQINLIPPNNGFYVCILWKSLYETCDTKVWHMDPLQRKQ